MMIKKLVAKIRHATITKASPDYKGSITIDEDIMDYLGIQEWQAVDVNLKGDDQYGKPFRGTTYVIPGPRGTGCVEANGALACHISKGDVVHINAYGYCDRDEWSESPIILESNLKFRL